MAEKAHQPSFLDSKGRPDSGVISMLDRQEAESLLRTPEQVERALGIKKSEGCTVPEAIQKMAKEDAETPVNDAFHKY